MTPRPCALFASVLVFVFGCGGAPTPSTDSRSATSASTAASNAESTSTPPEPTTPSALVVRLMELAAGPDAASVDGYVDQAFAARLPSGDTLADTLAVRVDGCTPELSESPGGAAVAIPPPMDDDSDEEAVRIEAILDDLQASTEVMATCMVQSTEDGETTTQEVALWVVAIHPDAQGRLRAMAWRTLLNER